MPAFGLSDESAGQEVRTSPRPTARATLDRGTCEYRFRDVREHDPAAVPHRFDIRVNHRSEPRGEHARAILVQVDEVGEGHPTKPGAARVDDEEARIIFVILPHEALVIPID